MHTGSKSHLPNAHYHIHIQYRYACTNTHTPHIPIQVSESPPEATHQPRISLSPPHHDFPANPEPLGASFSRYNDAYSPANSVPSTPEHVTPERRTRIYGQTENSTAIHSTSSHQTMHSASHRNSDSDTSPSKENHKRQNRSRSSHQSQMSLTKNSSDRALYSIDQDKIIHNNHQKTKTKNSSHVREATGPGQNGTRMSYQDSDCYANVFSSGQSHGVDTTTLVIHTPNTSLSFLPHTPHKLTLNTTYSPPNTQQMAAKSPANPQSPAGTPAKAPSPGKPALNKTHTTPKSPGTIRGLLAPSQAPAGSVAREILTDLAVHDVAVIKQYLSDAECKLALLETDNFGLRKRVREMENEAVQHTAQARLMQAKLVCLCYVCMCG
jgi:hypothetical protein